MIRTTCFVLAAVLLGNASAPGQNAAPANTPKLRVDLRGKVVGTKADQFIIETPERKQVTFYVDPKTEYRIGQKVVLYSDVRVGTVIDAHYVQQGDRYLVKTVVLLPNETFVPVPPTAAPVDATIVEGEIARVVGNDQIVIRAGSKEVILYVTPQTHYKLSPQGGSFAELRAGVPIQVFYTVDDRRNIANRIIALPRRNP